MDIDSDLSARLSVVLCIVILTLGGCATKQIDQGETSPKALFEAAHKARWARDFEVLRRLADPAHRRTYAEVDLLGKRFFEKIDVAEKLIETKIGKKAADAFRQNTFGAKPYSFFEPAMKDGKVQWDQVSIRVEGRRAWAEVDRTVLLSAIQKEDGRWYIAFSKSETSPEAVAMSKGMLESGIAHLDEIIRKINAGEISEDYFAASRLDESTPWPRGVKVIIEAGKAKLLPGTDLLAEDSKLSGGKVVRMRPGDPFKLSGFIASIDIKTELKNLHMFIVYAHNADTEVAVSIDDGKPVKVKLPKTGGLRDYRWAFAPLGLLPKGKHKVHVYAIHNSGVDRLDVVLFVKDGK